MSSTPYGRMEVNEDIEFERGFWKFQRVGRIGLAVFILLALLGFTGSGPLSNASASSPDGEIRVSYERIDRINAPSTLELSFQADQVSAGELKVWIDSGFVSNIRLDQITPEPDSVEVGPDRYVFAFKVSAESDPAPISFQFTPEKPGLAKATVGIVDGPSTSLQQFRFP